MLKLFIAVCFLTLYILAVCVDDDILAVWSDIAQISGFIDVFYYCTKLLARRLALST